MSARRLPGRASLIAEARRLRAAGLTYEAIAKRIAVPKGTIKSWIGIADPYGSFSRGITL